MNQSSYWCDTENIGISEIESRANYATQNGQFPTLVFISSDLYAELQKIMLGGTRVIAGQQMQPSSIMSIITSAGSLNVQQVRRLRNFLMIGRKEDFEALTKVGIDPIFWNDQERMFVDKAFEDLVILEGKDET